MSSGPTRQSTDLVVLLCPSLSPHPRHELRHREAADSEAVAVEAVVADSAAEAEAEAEVFFKKVVNWKYNRFKVAAEAADVVAEDQAVEAAEVAEPRSLSSHTDTAESSSPRARKTSS